MIAATRRSPTSWVFFFSSRRRHTRFKCDWSSDVCSSDLGSLSASPLNREESELEGYRIMLADDHALFRQGLRKIIEGVADLEVAGEAGDGLELLSLLQTTLPHLVILDISMPRLRGIEAVREVKKGFPAVKVLVLTMHREYLHQALSAGAEGYLLKEDADREL